MSSTLVSIIQDADTVKGLFDWVRAALRGVTNEQWTIIGVFASTIIGVWGIAQTYLHHRYNKRKAEDESRKAEEEKRKAAESGAQAENEIQARKATAASDALMEVVRKEFRLYSPSNKKPKAAAAPRVGEEWKLDKRLLSGYVLLNSLPGFSFRNEIREILFGSDIHNDLDERPYLDDIDRFLSGDRQHHIQKRNTFSVAWHPKYEILATAGDGNIPRVWDAASGESKTKRAYWHTSSPGDMLCWADSGELFISGEDVFDGNTGKYLCRSDSQWTNYFRYSNHQYGSLRGFHVDAGRGAHLSSTNNFTPWRPRSEQFVFGEFEKHLILRNGRTGRGEQIIDCGVDSNIIDLAWHPTGRFVALAFAEHNIRIIDIEEAKILANLSVERLVGWSPDGNILIVRGNKSPEQYVLWDALETQERPMPDDLTKEIWFQRFSKNISADGRRYIAMAQDEQERWSTNIYSLETDEKIATLPVTTSAAWSPIDGGLLATCKDSETHVWRLGS